MLNVYHRQAIEGFGFAAKIMAERETCPGLAANIRSALPALEAEGDKRTMLRVAYCGSFLPGMLQTPDYGEHTLRHEAQRLGDDPIPGDAMLMMREATVRRQQGLEANGAGRIIMAHAAAFGLNAAQRHGVPEEVWRTQVAKVARETGSSARDYKLCLIPADNLPELDPDPFAIFYGSDLAPQSFSETESGTNVGDPAVLVEAWRSLIGHAMGFEESAAYLANLAA